MWAASNRAIDAITGSASPSAPPRMLEMARQVLKVIVNQLKDIQTGIADLEKQVLVWHKNNPVSQRLATIPGIGPIIATAIAATIADPNAFRSGREFAAWLGLVPRQNSTGGKARLGGISKRGDIISAVCSSTAHTRFCFAQRRPRTIPG